MTTEQFMETEAEQLAEIGWIFQRNHDNLAGAEWEIVASGDFVGWFAVGKKNAALVVFPQKSGKGVNYEFQHFTENSGQMRPYPSDEVLELAQRLASEQGTLVCVFNGQGQFIGSKKPA